MNVLIPTQVSDTHAIAIMLAMQQKGHLATRWFVADFPDQQTATVTMEDGNAPSISLSGHDFGLRGE